MEEDILVFRNVMSATSDMIHKKILYSAARPQEVIGRYTAAMAGNFVGWVGMTIPWVRHEAARYALVDNLRCEMSDDHVGMLLGFAESCQALPEKEDYQHVAEKLADARLLFSDLVSAGLSGLVLVATLESTSRIFIPDLKVRALSCGCSDFTYTDCHGEADARHASDLVRAVEAEMSMGYQYGTAAVLEGVKVAGNLISCIWD